jgi:hypothetical protein
MTSSTKFPPANVSSTAAVNRAGTADGAAQASAVVNNFYESLGQHDTDAMTAAYDPKANFHDPLFGQLTGRHEVMEMWNTILPGIDPKKMHSDHEIESVTPRKDGSYEVKLHWDAHYELRGRHIDNSSETTMIVKNGKILDHKDDWDLDNWTRQALPGHLGGHPLTDALTAFSAHTFLKVKDFFDR